nr:DUF502 domain-containing protein [Gammaproteobacteria bacterium]
MKALSKIFLKGLAGVLPIAITAYLLYWLGASAESALGGLIKLVLPEALYWPGMGLVAGVLLVLLLGVLMNAWLVRSVLGAGERVLHRIPLV